MAVDLAKCRGPLGGLFPPPDDERYRLSEAQITTFEERGYITGIRVLDDERVAALRAEIAEIADPDHEGREFWYEYNGDVPGRGMLQAIGGWRVRPNLHDLLWHPAVTTPLKQLLGGPIRLLFDQLFCKPARQGGSVSWHQGYSYWTYTQPMAHATCWVAIDDADVANGCVHYLPGSHRWGLLPRPTGLMNEAESSLLDGLTEEQKAELDFVPAELEAGFASFHHPLVVHGSLPNSSTRPRRGTTIHVMRDGTRAAVDEPLVDGVPAWLVGGAGPCYPVEAHPGGPRLEGRYFPLL